MPLSSGLYAARELKRMGVRSKIVFLTMHAEAPMARQAFRAGANGYLLKQSASKELILAINEVLKGNSYITPLITDDPINFLVEASREPEDPITLTPRQREVLKFIAEGRIMKEIAAILNISARTVESHKYEMMQALGVQTTAELVQYAIRIGMIQ